MTKKERRQVLKFCVRIYARLDRMASENLKPGESNRRNENAMLWWYLDGRDFFFDLHFKEQETNAK